jgi:surfeit locus 1 family protein
MSKLPRFVFTPRWIVLLLVALSVAAVCIRLGIWQLDRLDQRRTMNAQIRSGLAAEPVALDQVTSPRSGGLQDLAYHRVEVTGTYDPQHEVLLYGRALDGEPGHHVLTPLVFATAGPGPGTDAILVDRGWVPFALDTPPVQEAAPPSGPVTVTGFLLPTEGDPDVVIERAADGRVLTVSHDEPVALGREISLELWPLPLQLQTQSPAQTTDLPRVVPPPELDEGPHLSYAIQWFTFATIALIGYVVLVRREVRDRARHQAGGGPG